MGTCKWEMELSTGAWSTACGNLFQVTEGNPEDNGMKFCPYCGNGISSFKYPYVVVGLTGDVGAGKTTTAHLLKNLGAFVEVRFKDPIVTTLLTLFPELTPAHFEDPALKDAPTAIVDGKIGLTPRHLMRTLGTSWGRDLIDKDLWVRSAIKRAWEEAENAEAIVFSDVRYPNEAQAVREFADSLDVPCKIIRIVRSLPDRGNSLWTDSENGREKLGIDYTVLNTGSLEYLATQLKERLEI